jgi:hypothetical protein
MAGGKCAPEGKSVNHLVNVLPLIEMKIRMIQKYKC